MSRKHVRARLGGVLLLCAACGGKASQGGSGFDDVDGGGNSPDGAPVSGSSCGCGPVIEDASLDVAMLSDGAINQPDANEGGGTVADGGLVDATPE